MTAPHPQSLVEDYLARLHAAAAGLPNDRRAELVEGITEHLESARAAGAAADDAAVRTLLERLGDPAEIVAAAWDLPDPSRPAPPARMTWQQWKNQPGTTLEGCALLLMTVGSLFLAWPVGVWLMWQSKKWTRWEKALGTFVVPGGPIAGFYLRILLPREHCPRSSNLIATTGPSPSSPPLQCSGGLPHWLTVSLTLMMVVLPLVVAALLWYIAKRRSRNDPRASPYAVVAPAAAWTGLEIAVIALLGPGALMLYGIGPLLGLMLLHTSPQWSSREKRRATTLMVFTVLAGAGFGFALLPRLNGGWAWTPLLAYVLPAVASMTAAISLYLALKRRVAAQSSPE